MKELTKNIERTLSVEGVVSKKEVKAEVLYIEPRILQFFEEMMADENLDSDVE